VLTPYKVCYNTVCYQLQTNTYSIQSHYNIICYPVYTNTYLIQSHYHVLLSTTNWKLVNTKLFIPPFVTDYESILKVVTTLFVTYYKPTLTPYKVVITRFVTHCKPIASP